MGGLAVCVCMRLCLVSALQDCARMGERTRVSRLLFLGQVYYYMLW
jgi:hypothetical protein